MMIFYFYLVFFNFSILYSVIPFNLVYVFQFIHPLCYFLSFFKPLSSLVEKFLHIYVYINIMYILVNMNFCLTKKFTTFWFHLFDLLWIEC